MAKLKADIVTAPSYWASALVNGDFSGIEEERERQAIERFLAAIAPARIVSIDDDAEPRFTWHYQLYCHDSCDASGGEVLDYVTLEKE